MNELELAWAFSVAIAMCSLSGFAVGGALGLDPNSRLALTPHFSLLLVVSNGALCRSFGVPVDSFRSVAVFLTITCTATVIARRWRFRMPGGARGDLRFPLVATGACFIAVVLAWIRAIGSMSARPQMPDNIFHVGAVTWMLREGSSWLGDVPTYSELSDGPTAYPGAWHSLAATIAAWSGTPALESSQILALVVGGCLWPMGCLALVRRHVDGRALPSVAAAAAALTFFAMPYQQMAWGVLWPYLLGLSLIPGSLLTLLNLQLAVVRRLPPRAIASHVLLGGLAILAGLVAHTSALFAVSLIGLPALALNLQAHRRRGWSVLAALCATVVITCLWALRPREMVENGSGRRRADGPELLVYSAGALSPEPIMALALAIIVGTCLIVVARRASHRWLLWGALAPLAVSAFTMWAPASVGSALSWPWWNEAARIRAVASTPLVLLIAAGVHEVSRRVGRLTLTARSVMVAATVAIASGSMWVNAHHLRYTYAPVDQRSWWVTPSDRTHLRDLAQLIPAGTTVAADPYVGGTHLYLDRDIRLLFPTEWSVDRNADKALLGRRLDSVRSDPVACEALRRLEVTYVVTGTRRSSWGDARTDAYSALGRIDEGDGYDKQAVRGSFTLWRVPDCADY